MAISLDIHSFGNNITRSINIDFASDFLASHVVGVSNEVRFFMKFNTNARDTDNKTYPPLIAESLSDLVLNGEKQRIINTANAYSDIKSMIIDYTYDYVNGHSSGENGATISERKPMKFY